MQNSAKIEYLPSVGPKTAKKFAKLGLGTIGDLINFYPRKYDDMTKLTPIELIPGLISSSWSCPESFTIKGSIIGIANKKTRRRGFTVTEAVLADGSASIKVVWFNQPYLAKMIKPGSEIILSGKVSFDRFSNGYVMESPERATKLRIVPRYSEVAGITSYYIEKIIDKLKSQMLEISDYLPDEIVKKHNLLPLNQAVLNIHQPKSSEALEAAKRRLAFDELFFISLRSSLAKDAIRKNKALPMKVENETVNNFIAKLPFALTSDQKKAISHITQDLEKSSPMNRLLNGDVGSGKTVVAAIAAYATFKAGYKTLLMVPTNILAIQHFETFCKLFCNFGVKIGLLTSSGWEISNSEFLISNQIPNPNTKNSKIADRKSLTDNCDIIVGTQALIQKGVEFNDIGLVVIDEQHRFGVDQRAKLSEITNKNQKDILRVNESNIAMQQCNNQKMKPHFLSMTATPIPRTLHLALFGDLDVSIISEKPANRKEIKTRFVEEHNRNKAYQFIGENIRRGRQAFVICPLIEESMDSEVEARELWEEDRKSVKIEYEKLQKVFPEFKIGMLHGKMKAGEKEEIMSKYIDQEIKILVSTSVVEVGVDVPNATVMVIEDAERFGLAQIHQFRGRVGRGEHQSFCFLFSNSRSEKALTRLKNLENISDGFKLAEVDLETRGPGAIFGTEQSGLLDLKMASLSNLNLIEEASEAAKKIAPEIDKYPKLKENISGYFVNKHLE